MTLNKTIDLRALVGKMSRMNVRGWAVNHHGHTYVIYHEGPGRMEELDFEEVKEARHLQYRGARAAVTARREDPWDRPDRIFYLSLSNATNGARFVSELTRVLSHAGRRRIAGSPVMEATKDKDVRGHFSRLRDQAKLAKLQSDARRGEAKDAGVRAEIRRALKRSQAKYNLTNKQVVDILQEEAKLLLVEDVMEG